MITHPVRPDPFAQGAPPPRSDRSTGVPRRAALTALVAVFSLVAVACSDDGAGGGATVGTTAGTAPAGTAAPAGGSSPDVPAATSTPAVTAPVDPTTVSDEEVAGLVYMREEEQLAHDLYAMLGDRWELRAFENIVTAEQHHIDAVVEVLDRYGIDDPAADNDPGEFTDPGLQALYDELAARGSESAEAALAAGALVEERDIADLRERSAATDLTDLVALYAELERGSRNHLRAFTSQLASLGVTYAPTVLDPDDYDAIVSTPMERGRDRQP